MSDNSTPMSGNMIKSDGTVINIADLIRGTVVGHRDDADTFLPRSGTMIKSDGTVVNIADAIENFAKVDSELSSNSENPVQNKVITKALGNCLTEDTETAGSYYYLAGGNNDLIELLVHHRLGVITNGINYDSTNNPTPDGMEFPLLVIGSAIERGYARFIAIDFNGKFYKGTAKLSNNSITYE